MRIFGSSWGSVERLRWWERLALLLLLTAVVGFGIVVEIRSAFLKRRMGDLGCYLRAAWALRAGPSLYDVVEDNRWHYNYPPLYAILMMPLADPPTRDLSLAATRAAGLAASPLGHGPLLAAAALGAEATIMYPDIGPTAPFAVSVALCYVLNLVFLALGVHGLASALEGASVFSPRGRLPWGARRWWVLRTLPVIICLPPIGHTLGRGQVNLLLLALVCGLIAGLITGRRFQAGLCLAGAVCLKVFPAYLFLAPLWRRDGRCLAGAGVGLLLGLVLIPAAVLGPRRAMEVNRQLLRVTLGPALNMSQDGSRADELINVTATDNVAYLAVLHNAMHPEPESRPAVADATVRRAHWGLGALFTLLTLLAGRRRVGGASAPALTLWIGALTLIMGLTCPVCHAHYFALAIPAVMGLIALGWERRGWAGSLVGPGLVAVLGVELVAAILPLLPALSFLQDLGLVMYANMLLWGACCLALVRLPVAAPAALGQAVPAILAYRAAPGAPPPRARAC